MDWKTLISFLSFILALSKFILDEYRLKQKMKKEREEERLRQQEEQKEKGKVPILHERTSTASGKSQTVKGMLTKVPLTSILIIHYPMYPFQDRYHFI